MCSLNMKIYKISFKSKVNFKIIHNEKFRIFLFCKINPNTNVWHYTGIMRAGHTYFLYRNFVLFFMTEQS